MNAEDPKLLGLIDLISLNEALIKAAEREEVGVTFIQSIKDDDFLSYEGLLEAAKKCLGLLQHIGINPGEELLIQIEDNRQFLIVFWACLLGRIVAVPLSVGKQVEQKKKLFNVLEHLDNPYLITSKENQKRVEKFAYQNEFEDTIQKLGDKTIDVDLIESGTIRGKIQSVALDDIAYIQYSSGSTGNPKGVILTHENLLANTQAIVRRGEMTSNESMLSWMPLTHDMGLICFHLSSVVAGLKQYLMPTALFIRRPILWIEKASTYKVSFLYSPNFGLQYFLSAFENFSKPKWDLSKIRLIYNGAEPISAELCEQFQKELSPYKLSPFTMFPGYGLAEASVAVSLPIPGTPVTSYFLKRDTLNIGQKAELLTPDKHKLGLSFVEVGKVVNDCEVRICNNNNRVLLEGFVGQIQIRGKNVCQGYYNNPEATQQLFTSDGWANTGDLGFLKAGNLVVTGRIKEMIIINGQNFYPHDIERVTQSIEEIKEGKIVAATIKNPIDGFEEPAIFVLFKKSISQFIPLLRQIQKVLFDEMGITVNIVIPIRKIPKTTSGKIRRFQLTNTFQQGGFEVKMRTIAEELQAIQQEETAGLSDLEKLIKLGEECLFISNIHVETNLFEYGLDSLQTSRFCSLIQEEFQVNLSMNEIFENPSLKHIYQLIIRKESHSPVEIPPTNEEENYSVSFAQERLWLLHQYENSLTAYNISICFEIQGVINTANLEKAFRQVIQKHEILRTRFLIKDGEIKQNILPVEEVDFQVQTRNLTDASNLELLLNKNISEAANYMFDLASGKLLKLFLLQKAGQKNTLILTIHHIISDGWSIDLLIGEINNVYHALQKKISPNLNQLSIQHKDYVEWSRENMKEESFLVAKRYWMKELGGEIPALDLPGYQSSARTRGLKGAVEKFIFPEKLQTDLKSFSKEQHTTVFTCLLSVLNLLLYKYTNQTDIIIGTSSAGRTHRQLQDQIGFFINTLCIRSQFKPEDPFLSFLENTRLKLSQALKYQDYPFEKIIDELDLQKNRSRSPIFDVLFLYQNFDTELFAQESDLKQTKSFTPEIHNTLIDLQIEFIERESRLNLEIKYNPDIYTSKQICSLSSHFQTLLAAILHKPEKPIHAYSILSLREEKQALEIGLLQHKEKSAPIITLFEKQVKAHPNKYAVSDGQNRLTYQELNFESNKLAHLLREKHQVGVGDLIGLSMQRSTRLLVSLLAIIKSGAAFVSIDPEYPTQRIQYILSNSCPKLILADQKSLPQLVIEGKEKRGGTQVVIDELEAELSAYSTENPSPLHKEADLAYVLYTSGTTGQPKGVMIEQGSMWDYVDTFSTYFSIQSTDVVLQQSSTSFDTSIEEIFPAWTQGACVLMIPKEGGDIEKMLTYIEKYSVSILSTTPRVLRELNEHAKRLQGLRVVISGGEELHWNQIDQIIERVDVYNSYGPTESTVCATFGKLEPNKTISLGKPLPNREILLLDNYDNIQAIGIVGEICISGKGLSRGYLGDEQLTKVKFTKHPWDQSRYIYRTGDLGSWTEEGELLFHGRKDRQVKIRGYRIELGEIESTLMDHPKVEEVVVKYQKETSEKEACLLAFYKAKGNVKNSDLRAFLSNRLPVYMVPQYFDQLKEIPRNAHGKPDINSLPSPKALLEKNEVVYLAPDKKLEQELGCIWEEILGKKRIGILDNFFELGGHSLKAMQVAGQIHNNYGIELSLSQLFAAPTLKELAIIVAAQNQTSFNEIEPLSRQTDYLLSHSQRRIWILDQMDALKIAYNMPFSFWLIGDLDRSVLSDVFQTLVERHEILRTIFKGVGEEPRQHILEPSEIQFEINYEDLREDKSRLKRVYREAEIEAKTPFDLKNAPLFRVKLLQVEDQKYSFLLTIHHIIADGWSIEILLEEFHTLYIAYSQKLSDELEPLSIHYKDFALWQRKRFSDSEIQKQGKYWKEVFKGDIPILEFPTDSMRPAVKRVEGKSIARTWSKELRDSLTLMGQEHGASLYMVLLAGLKALLYRYTNQEDIIIGCPVAGRERIALKNQLGFYVNTVALRTVLSVEDNFSDLLEKVRKTTLEGLEHQAYPFDNLIEELQLERDLSRSPLFDIMLNLHNVDIINKTSLAWQDLYMIENPTDSKISRFDLEFDVRNREDGLHISITYDKELFADSRMEKLMLHFENLLSSVCLNSKQPLLEIAYLKEEERRSLLKWGTGVNLQPDKFKQHNWVNSFEFQVTKTPDLLALEDEEFSLTYDQLNKQANRLANYLKNSYKIKAEDRIALLMDKSAWNIIAVLGILKSGAAYVPIDPNYPNERISLILEDVQAQLVLTNEEKTLSKSIKSKYNFLSIFKDWDKDVSNEVHNPAPTYKSNHLAYILYTSGSTGTPKGVMIEHHSLITYVDWANQFYFDGTSAYTFAFCTSLSFDLTITSIFSTLLRGDKIVVYPQDGISDLLTNIFKPTSNVNTVKLTPAHISALSYLPISATNISTVILGGEALSREQLDILFQLNSEMHIYNEYGPTEATVGCTVSRIKSLHDPISIGNPMDHVQIFILDKQMNMQPIGIAGEIYIGGKGLARGYVNQIQLSRENFIEKHVEGKIIRLYRTGDMGFWRDDGSITFLGRKDTQIKLRGYRIELGEIESALHQLTWVNQAVILLNQQDTRNPRLVAFYTGDEKVELSTFRKEVSNFLPLYMIPDALVFLETFPLTLNGKIDRKALHKTGIDERPQEVYTPPKTEIELSIVKIWEKVLGHKPIGLTDDFFQLGGQSLKAIWILAQIKQLTNVGINLVQFMKNPTIEYQVKEIEVIKWLKDQDKKRPDNERLEEIIL